MKAAAACQQHSLRRLKVEDIRKQQRMRRGTVACSQVNSHTSNAAESVTHEFPTSKLGRCGA